MSNSYIKKSLIKGQIINGTTIENGDIKVIYRNIQEQETISIGYKNIQITIPFKDIETIKTDRRTTTNER